MRKHLLAGATALALVAGIGYLLAQPVGQNQVSGNECWNAGQGPGGPSTGFMCVNVVSGRTPVAPVTITTSFTIGVGAALNLGAGGNLIVSAQPLAATITLPPNPVPDGAKIGYCNVTASPFATNVVTFAANSGQSLATAVTLTTQAATSCAVVEWVQSQTTWYRIQ